MDIMNIWRLCESIIPSLRFLDPWVTCGRLCARPDVPLPAHPKNSDVSCFSRREESPKMADTLPGGGEVTKDKLVS